MAILYTSLNEIWSFRPCLTGWDKIRAAHKHNPWDTPIELAACLETNTASDVLWLIGKRKTEVQIAVNAAKKIADSVQRYNNISSTYAAAAADAAASTFSTDAAAAAAFAADAAATGSTSSDTDWKEQEKINRQFLLEAIREYEANN